MVYVWAFWAVIRIFLFFSPDPISASFIIPEPLSTQLFFLTGFVLILIWVVLTYWKRNRTRSRMLGMSAKDLLDIPPGEFEEITAELYRLIGHQAKRIGASGDHGVDVVIKAKNGQKWIVQCKRWRKPVGEAVIRDFYGTLHHEKAAQGAIIATSGFSQQAIEWAKGKPLYLYDGEDFIKMWKRAEKEHHKKKSAGK